MDAPIDAYWSKRIDHVRLALEANQFSVSVVDSAAAAVALVTDTLIPAAAPASVSWGGSLTVIHSGLYDALKDRTDFEVLDTYDKSLDPKAMIERRRQALLVDFFITGTNALTADGMLVNLDMIGNRVAALAFGPKQVVVLVGRNKIVGDLDEAIDRIKSYAAPVNVMRLDKKTPCAKTGECADCSSPDRICNVWTISEKSFPKGRIHVVLINADLGF